MGHRLGVLLIAVEMGHLSSLKVFLLLLPQEHFSFQNAVYRENLTNTVLKSDRLSQSLT